MLERDRLQALEMIATRKPLDQILAQLVRMVERQYPGMLAVISLINPGYERPLLHGGGQLVLGVAIVMVAAGWLIMRAITDIKV